MASHAYMSRRTKRLKLENDKLRLSHEKRPVVPPVIAIGERDKQENSIDFIDRIFADDWPVRQSRIS